MADSEQQQPTADKTSLALIDRLGRIALVIVAIQIVAGIAYGGWAFSATTPPIPELTPIRDRCDVHSDQALNRAYQALGNGDWQAAHDRLDTLIADQPDNGCLYALRGRSNAFLGDLESARADLEQAIELAPDSALAFQYRGELRALFRDEASSYEAALSDLTNSLDLKADDPYTWYLLGLLYEQNQYCDQAIAAYGSSILLNPEAADSYRNRGWLRITCFRDGRYFAEGMADYARAIELRPDDIDLQLARADAVAEHGNADALYLRVAEIASDDDGRLIQIAQRPGFSHYAALDLLNQVLDGQREMDSGTRAAFLRIRAERLWAVRSEKAALADLDEALDLDSSSPTHWLLYSRYIDEHDPLAAIALLDEALLRFDDDCLDCALRRAELHVATGHYEEAITYYQAAGIRYWDYSYYHLFNAYVATGRLDEASDMLAYALTTPEFEYELDVITSMYLSLETRLGQQGNYDFLSALHTQMPDDALLQVMVAAAAFDLENWTLAREYADAVQSDGIAGKMAMAVRYMALYHMEGIGAAFDELGEQDIMDGTAFYLRQMVDGDLMCVAYAYQKARDPNVSFRQWLETGDTCRYDDEDDLEPAADYVNGLFLDRAGLTRLALESYQRFVEAYAIEDAARAEALQRIEALEQNGSPD